MPRLPQDLVRPKLHLQTSRDMETAAYVGMRVRDAIAVLKPCATEGMRREFLSTVAAAAPPRLGPRDPNGMIRRVSEFLNLRPAQLAAARYTEIYMELIQIPHSLSNLVRIQDKGKYVIPTDHVTECMDFFKLACVGC